MKGKIGKIIVLLSARVIVAILESLGVDRVITFDLHAGQIQGFFSNNTPFDNLYLESYFLRYISKNIIEIMKLKIILLYHLMKEV